MVILGLDPGIARTGFGVIDTNQPFPFVSCGVLTTPAHDPLPARLSSLADHLTTLIKQTRPQRAVVEDIFFGTNTTTAITTAQARGVILHILNQHHILITSLTPLQIKSRLCSYGRATKQQIQDQVKVQLKLDRIPQPDDAADGLAAALCAMKSDNHELRKPNNKGRPSLTSPQSRTKAGHTEGPDKKQVATRKNSRGPSDTEIDIPKKSYDKPLNQPLTYV